MMSWMKIIRFGALVGAVFAVIYMPSAAWAPSAAGAPTGEPPLGVVTKSGSGPRLQGVGLVEFLNADNPEKTARGARISVRLRLKKEMYAFFALIPEYGCSADFLFACDPTDDACPGSGLGICEANLFQGLGGQEETQEMLIAALREAVLAEFFEDECGEGGDMCPDVDLVFREIEEYALFDDKPFDGTSLFVIADITVQTTQRP
jgi:hypothetical protein